MKKTFSIFLLLSFFLSACSALALSSTDPTSTIKNTGVPTQIVVATATPLPTLIGGGGQISYWAQDDASVNIYLVDLKNPSYEARIIATGESPAWSPDGTQMAFVKYTDTGSDIYIMNADGSNLRQLTAMDGGEWEPDWSPDGKQLAYSSEHHSIHVMDADGSNDRSIISGFYSPAWSPDGTRFAFLYEGGSLSADLYISSADFKNLRRLVGNVNWSSRPSWSPDSRGIAYGCQSPNTQICVVRLDGTGMDVLTKEGINGSPSWSPDGSWIAFSSYRDGNWEIYVMRADGTDQTRITSNSLEDFGPTWRP